VSVQPTFDDVTADRIPSVVELASAARALIREVDPAVVEVFWPRQGTVGFGVGPKKFTEHYAYLALHPRHVNLGFNQGAELPDPAGLLGGPGAKLRHLKLTSVDQLAQPEIRELLIAARAHRLATQGSADS
jgi:hypothetical protein